MNNIKRKSFMIMLALTLVAGSFVIPSYATEAQMQNEEAYSINDNLEVIQYISAVGNAEKQEMIKDLFSVEYLELVFTDDNHYQDSLSNQQIFDKRNIVILNEIEDLSKLDMAALDKVIDKQISNIVDKAKNNSNIVILPSSYDVLTKYGYTDVVADLKQEEQIATSSSTGTKLLYGEVSLKSANTGYEKTATGYIKNGSGEIAAIYKLTIQWFTNGSDKIYYWDLYNKSTSDTGKYRHIKHIHNFAKTEASGTVLTVERESKFKKTLYVPAIVPAYNYILIYVECFRNGNIDASASTYASYN
jgi:hypothetical protein